MLDALAAHISARGCFSSCNLVELIEDNDPVLGSSDIVVCFNEESFDAGFDVLSDVTGLCEGVAVANRERDLDLLAEGSLTCQ